MPVVSRTFQVPLSMQLARIKTTSARIFSLARNGELILPFSRRNQSWQNKVCASRGASSRILNRFQRRASHTESRLVSGTNENVVRHVTEFCQHNDWKSFGASISRVTKKLHTTAIFGESGSGIAETDVIEVEADIIVEESYGVDDELKSLLPQLKSDCPRLVSLAIDGWEKFDDVARVSLALLLCGDDYIRQMNRQWREEDVPTDVLSFPQMDDHIINNEVHGLLHLLGYDHEVGEEERVEMAEEEERVMGEMGWGGRGLIEAIGGESTAEGEGGGEQLLFCDMDGTLLDSHSRVTESTARALRAAEERGVRVVIATGKARPAAIRALAAVGLAGEGGVIGEKTAGVFLQGLQVYSPGGGLVHTAQLSADICEQAFKFSLHHGTALVGFSGDFCVTLFQHPLVDDLHFRYYEPKAEVLPSLEALMKQAEERPIQKLLFYDTVEGTRDFIRPHWSAAMQKRAVVTQAVNTMVEILPFGQSKANGVALLCKEMGVAMEEIMALGDGENDLEMLRMAGLGVAMANGAAKTLEVADEIVASNDEDGIAEAIEKFILC